MNVLILLPPSPTRHIHRFNDDPPDLHLDRNDMELHEIGRQHVIDCMAKIGQTLSSPTAQRRLVSLGDLGAYGEAGTTASFELAKAYLDGFALDYNLVTGNHDLEGMDQFDTGKGGCLAGRGTYISTNDHPPTLRTLDLENLVEWQRVFGLKTPYFCHQVRRCCWFTHHIMLIRTGQPRICMYPHHSLAHTHAHTRTDRQEDPVRWAEHDTLPVGTLLEPRGVHPQNADHVAGGAAPKAPGGGGLAGCVFGRLCWMEMRHMRVWNHALLTRFSP